MPERPRLLSRLRHRRLAVLLGVGGPTLVVLALVVAAFTVVAPVLAPPEPATAAHRRDRLDFLQYNVQFLSPVDGFAFDGHWPNSATRANEIGRQLACFDVIALNETINDTSRDNIVSAMEANAPYCEKPALLPGGRFFDVVHGPDLAPGVITIPTPDELVDVLDSSSNPIVDDEVAIVSRLPVISTHMHRFTRGSGIDGFAAKGAVHARLWSCCGETAEAAIDVFASHLDTDAGIRASQVDELATFVATHSSPGRTAVVMGDFNIVGNAAQQADPASEYSRMMSAFRTRVDPGIVDVGTGLGGTNEARNERIDYLLVARAGLSGGTPAVEDFPHPTAAAPHTTLSDHAGVSLRGATWQPADRPPQVGPAEAKRVTARVTRLQARASDACNDFTDYMGRGSVNDGRTATSASFPLREGNDIGPDWAVSQDVPAGVGEVRVDIHVQDDDDVVCGQNDDDIDVTDLGGPRFSAVVDFADRGIVHQVDGNGNRVRVLGRYGDPLFTEGTEGDRARMTVVIDAVPLAAEPPPPAPRTDVERVVRVSVDRLRAVSTDSCNERMDFMGQLELRNGVPTTNRSFGVREGNDIAPGWSVEAVAPPGVTTVDAIVRIDDDDDAFCGGGDDGVDVSPLPGDRQLRLRIDLAAGRLRLLDKNLAETGTEVGFAGRPVPLQGTEPDETGAIDLTVTVTPR